MDRERQCVHSDWWMMARRPVQSLQCRAASRFSKKWQMFSQAVPSCDVVGAGRQSDALSVMERNGRQERTERSATGAHRAQFSRQRYEAVQPCTFPSQSQQRTTGGRPVRAAHDADSEAETRVPAWITWQASGHPFEWVRLPSEARRTEEGAAEGVTGETGQAL